MWSTARCVKFGKSECVQHKKKVYLYSSQHVIINLRKYYSTTNKLILEVWRPCKALEVFFFFFFNSKGTKEGERKKLIFQLFVFFSLPILWGFYVLLKQGQESLAWILSFLGGRSSLLRPPGSFQSAVSSNRAWSTQKWSFFVDQLQAHVLFHGRIFCKRKSTSYPFAREKRIFRGYYEKEGNLCTPMESFQSGFLWGTSFNSSLPALLLSLLPSFPLSLPPFLPSCWS